MTKLLVTCRSLIRPAIQRHVYEFPTAWMPAYFVPIYYETNRKGIRCSLDSGERLKFTYILFHSQNFGDFVEQDSQKVTETTYSAHLC